MTQEFTNFWHAPKYQMELLTATYITHRFTPHFHEGYAIGVIERGVEEYDYRREHYVAHHGCMVIINPGEIHTGNAWGEDGWSYRMTYPGVTTLRQIASEMTGKVWDMPFFRETIIRDKDIVAQFRAMHQAMEANESRMTQDVLLRETFAPLIVRYADNRPNIFKMTPAQHAIERARDYIHAYYHDDISLDSVADAAGLSPFHLSRVFKKETGLPPHKYLTQVRVHRARAMLTGGLPIADVALATGFADQSHLTKWFKRVIGVPPGAYQQSS